MTLYGLLLAFTLTYWQANRVASCDSSHPGRASVHTRRSLLTHQPVRGVDLRSVDRRAALVYVQRFCVGRSARRRRAFLPAPGMDWLSSCTDADKPDLPPPGKHRFNGQTPRAWNVSAPIYRLRCSAELVLLFFLISRYSCDLLGAVGRNGIQLGRKRGHLVISPNQTVGSPSLLVASAAAGGWRRRTEGASIQGQHTATEEAISLGRWLPGYGGWRRAAHSPTRLRASNWHRCRWCVSFWRISYSLAASSSSGGGGFLSVCIHAHHGAGTSAADCSCITRVRLWLVYVSNGGKVHRLFFCCWWGGCR